MYTGIYRPNRKLPAPAGILSILFKNNRLGLRTSCHCDSKHQIILNSFRGQQATWLRNALHVDADQQDQLVVLLRSVYICEQSKSKPNSGGLEPHCPKIISIFIEHFKKERAGYGLSIEMPLQPVSSYACVTKSICLFTQLPLTGNKVQT
jgi:hypothetical protein